MLSSNSTAMALSESATTIPPDSVIFGRSPAMRDLADKLHKVANSNVSVLIQGESGSGKEIFARLLHRYSPWSSGPFVKVSCPSIPGTLMESELFGYEKGAFTGAYGTKAGRVEMAHRGTLFMDEIGELDLSLQAKLLQLLQDGQFCRIGAQEDKKIEVRFVCATNRDMDDEVATGSFRQDLYYRINVFNLYVPPLRERTIDVPDLVSYFYQTFKQAYNRGIAPVSGHLMQLFISYHWPGNIRELENMMKRFVILGSEDAIIADLLSASRDTQKDFTFVNDAKVSLKQLTKQAVRKLERDIILQAMQANHWNRKKAAVALSISYRALLYKLKEGGLLSQRMLKKTQINSIEGPD